MTRSPKHEELFWSRLRQTEDGCWEWQAKLNKQGYAQFGRTYVHRLTYQALEGPIPDGLELDHLCQNPACGNPGHLEPVTHAENIRRGKAATKTHCVSGHELSGENLIIKSRRIGGATYRQCRICLAAQNRAYQTRKRLVA